jgi:hypothetical protein
MIGRITCKQAHRLVSERMDRPLSNGERLRLWLHLRFCVACSRFEQHMAAIRGAVRRLGQ